MRERPQNEVNRNDREGLEGGTQRAHRASAENVHSIALPSAMTERLSQTTMMLRTRLARWLRVDAEMPQPIQRAVRRPYLCFGLTMLLSWALVVGLKLRVLADRQAFGLVGLMLVATAAGWGCLIMAWRARRLAASCDHLLCPECLYDLRTLDATGTCSECGRPYEHNAVRALWFHAERRLKRGNSNDDYTA